ncbi:stage II sporulation protein M [Halosimplex marinum]|uniref:stage II sporulation protein M n=1 Tax=Halosimplex marinum TaxID=3396620 RepID=UPI003F565691
MSGDSDRRDAEGSTDPDPDQDLGPNRDPDGGPESNDGTSGGSIRALHREARFTRWLRWHLVAALVVFFGSAFAAYAVVGSIPVAQLEALIEQLQAEAPADSPLPELAFVPLLVNNLRALLLIGLGAVTGGLLSLFGLVVNGVIVGAVVSVVVRQTSWAVILALLLPHGVIELSAFFVAAAVGLRVPHRVVRYLLGWDEKPLTRVELYELAVIGAVLVVMILVAAWIEVYLTRDVAEWLLGPGALPE